MGDNANENTVAHYSQSMRFPSFTIAKGGAGVTRVTVTTGIPNCAFFFYASANGVSPDVTIPNINVTLSYGELSVDVLGFAILVAPINNAAIVISDGNGFFSASIGVSGGPGNNPLDFWVACSPSTGNFVSRKLTNADFGP